jgi:site-specific DNA recombinase
VRHLYAEVDRRRVGAELQLFAGAAEAGEAYIRSQRESGWVAVAKGYDDGGCSGGNLERPALQRLLEDIAAGKVDVVVVYKVDRLSRSLLDFARLIGVFEQRGVSFLSVTQGFNTTISMGRLTLNILLSFAEFEGDLISERTRDKLGAARRKGKWSRAPMQIAASPAAAPPRPQLRPVLPHRS